MCICIVNCVCNGHAVHSFRSVTPSLKRGGIRQSPSAGRKLAAVLCPWAVVWAFLWKGIKWLGTIVAGTACYGCWLMEVFNYGQPKEHPYRMQYKWTS